MEKLDRLVWAEGLSVRAYGVRLGLRASEPGVLGPLIERLPPEWKPAASPVVDRVYSYVAGGQAPRSRVHPFRKPLSIRGDGERRPEELGAVAGRRPLPVRAIVEAPYREGPRWRPRERTPAQGALILLSQALQGRTDPVRTMSAVRAAA